MKQNFYPPDDSGDRILLYEGPVTNHYEPTHTVRRGPNVTNAPLPPPGWYRDPTGVPRQAYWDGQQWHNVAPPPPPRKSSWKLVTALIVGLTALALIVTVVRNGHTGSPGSVFGPELAPMNFTVSDGKFSFRVTGVERSPGAEWLSREANSCL